MKRILVLEDDELFSMVIKDVLSESGFLVEVAQDGDAALQLMHSLQPDIFFTDWRFSGSVTSVDVANKLREVNPALMVILLTGIVGQEAAHAAENLGAFRLLLKPSSIDDIVSAAQQAAHVLDTAS